MVFIEHNHRLELHTLHWFVLFSSTIHITSKSPFMLWTLDISKTAKSTWGSCTLDITSQFYFWTCTCMLLRYFHSHTVYGYYYNLIYLYDLRRGERWIDFFLFLCICDQVHAGLVISICAILTSRRLGAYSSVLFWQVPYI